MQDHKNDCHISSWRFLLIDDNGVTDIYSGTGISSIRVLHVTTSASFGAHQDPDPPADGEEGEEP